MTTKLADAPHDCISRVRFSPVQARHLLVSSWDAHLRIYDVHSGEGLAICQQNQALLDCAYSGDGTRALCAGLEGKLVSWDPQTSQTEVIGQHDKAIRCVETHIPTRQVFTGSWDRTVRAWDPRCGGAGPVSVMHLGAKAFCMDLGTDKLVVGAADRCIHIYDTRRLGQPMEKRESSLKHQVRALVISIDGLSYVSGSVEGRVALEYFDPSENERARYAFKCHRGKGPDGGDIVHPVNSMAIHPNYGTFATGGSDGGVCVWDGGAKKRLWRLNPFDTAVSSLGFSPDGSMIAMGVSYTFDDGDKAQVPRPELAVRAITESEVMPKPK